MYRSPVLDGFQVASINGLILDKWLELGGPNSDLGFPIADEAMTADGVGRFSIFQHGSIYWHPDTGAHSISGGIFNKWAINGFEAGQFGYPIAEPETHSGLKMSQEFQHGEISGYAEPIPSIAALLPLTESELDEAHDLLVADFSERGISLEAGFHEAFTRTKESYDYTLEQITGSIGSSSKVQRTFESQQFEPNAIIDPQKCTFIAPGNERTNRGDIFYSAAIRYGIINHGHNGIFISKGSSDPRNIETVEAVGAPDGVMRLSGANRRGVCRPVYLSVKTTSDIRNNAASFAESKIGAGYNSNFLTTRIGSLDKSSYNCSQLVWSAFKRASGGGLDIGERFPYEPYQPAVYPLDILNSHNTVEIQ